MDYRLRPLGTTCAASGQPLEPGQSCVSALLDDDGQHTRLDFAAEAWDGPPEHCVGWWRRTVPPAEEKARTLDVESLMERLEQLAEEDAPHQAPLMYVMALWLMRRRRLRLQGSEVIDGVSRLLLEGSGGEGPFAIREQSLSRDDAEQLQAALFDVAPAEVEPVAATEPTSDEPGETAAASHEEAA